MKKRSKLGLTLLALTVLTGVAVSMTGCSNMAYLAQSAQGHLQLLTAAQPVPQWLDKHDLPAPLRARLELSQVMRNFAVSELHLPDNDSYRRYADLRRSAAVWNVVAAPPLSLQLKTSCFPVTGCVGYQGFYEREKADAQAAKLKAEGFEVSVYGVPAYSTLGWLNWLGGDPLLNTFINYSEGELARLIFHELAHQVVYAKDDTQFNESFATAVERIGVKRWLARAGANQTNEDYARSQERQEQFRTLVMGYRSQLDTLYRSDAPLGVKIERKAALLARMRQEHAQLKTSAWAGYAGYDGWFERANNASLSVMGAYNEFVPGFEALFEAQGRDFVRFYEQVQILSALPMAQRHAALKF